MNDSITDRRIVLITGASMGIGKFCADRLHRKGYRVYGTSRQAEMGSSPGRVSHFPYRMIRMDVNDNDSVNQGVASVLAEASRIDVVVNNAGYSLSGALEDTTIEEAKAQFDTNFFGVLRICRAVLPHMRRQQYGYIVNISSLGGIIGLPFHSMYSASKFALEAISEALRIEVEPFGIRVSIIEPGNYQTGLTDSRVLSAAAEKNSAYNERFLRALAIMERDERNAPEPEQVARVLEQVITTDRPRLCYPVDPGLMKLAAPAKRLLPDWLMEALIKKIFEL